MVVVSLLGSTTGYDTPEAADQAAAAAVSTYIGPEPYPGVKFQRWVVIQDSNSHSWALLAQHRPDFVTGENSAGDQSPIKNPNRDYCFTPPTEYKVAAWHGMFFDDAWYRYDSATNQISPV